MYVTAAVPIHKHNIMKLLELGNIMILLLIMILISVMTIETEEKFSVLQYWQHNITVNIIRFIVQKYSHQ